MSRRARTAGLLGLLAWETFAAVALWRLGAIAWILNQYREALS